MSIAVSIKVQDGVVLASDSCVLHKGQIYFNADKTVAPVRGLPIGAMISGDGAIGLTSVLNHLRDFGQQAVLKTSPLRVDRATYSLRSVVSAIADHLSDASVHESANTLTSLIVSGYSAQNNLPETWRILLDGRVRVEPELIWGPNEYGITWDGERECLDRLLCGTSHQLRSVAQEFGMSGDAAGRFVARVGEACESDLVSPGMPLHDAIDLARFLVETTIAFIGFCLDRQPKLVGGMVDIATITRHDGFRWIQRKRNALGANGTR
ncbi:MAG TPA: hypothetical protein VMU56_04390 [Beijerinckiaceae bacterium]|nr:hypothetical protein [Beijerinckiaceae bacterium]